MNTIFKLAYRNLWRNKRRTLITASSIAFAVIIALFMRSMQLGNYESSFSQTIKATTGHIELHGDGYWEDKTINNALIIDEQIQDALDYLDGIEITLPKINSYLLASTGDVTKGVVITGIDPSKYQRFYDLKKHLVLGNYIINGDNALLIGEGVAKYFSLSVNDTLVLFGSGYHGMTAVGKYRVKGILKLPNPILNKSMIYLNLPDCQYLFALDNGVTSLSVHLKDSKQLQSIQENIITKVDTSKVEVLSWEVMNKELIQAMATDNAFGMIMIGIIYMVVGFGIFGTIFMMTLERRREFSILIAIGLKKVSLTIMVFIESMFVGALGAFSGLLISVPMLFYLYNNPIPLGEEYAEKLAQFNMEPLLRFSLELKMLAGQTGVVLLISLVAALIPVYTISKLKFADALRGK